MNLNLNLSSKVLQYYYTWKKVGNKLVFTNVIDSTKVCQIEYNKTFKRDQGRVLLIKDNKILDKKKCMTITKAYKLDQWVYTTVGAERYAELHEFLQTKAFHDLLGKRLSPELFDQPEGSSEYDTIKYLMDTHQQLTAPKKAYFSFEFVSKHDDFIPFINSLGYKLKKEKYKYTINTTPSLDAKQIKADLKQKIMDYIKYHPESYYKDE